MQGDEAANKNRDDSVICVKNPQPSLGCASMSGFLSTRLLYQLYQSGVLATGLQAPGILNSKFPIAMQSMTASTEIPWMDSIWQSQQSAFRTTGDACVADGRGFSLVGIEIFGVLVALSSVLFRIPLALVSTTSSAYVCRRICNFCISQYSSLDSLELSKKLAFFVLSVLDGKLRGIDSATVSYRGLSYVLSLSVSDRYLGSVLAPLSWGCREGAFTGYEPEYRARA